MRDFSFSILSVYAGYPVKGLSLLAVETDHEIYSLLHIEWNDARVLVSGLWWPGAVRVEWKR